MLNFKKTLSTLASFAVLATVLPSGQTIFVPGVAVDRSPVLESVTFVHYRDGSVKSDFAAKTRPVTCYSFISKGAKLTEIENVLVNSTGSGMIEADVLNNVVAGMNEWDGHTSAAIWGNASLDYTADFDSVADGRNELSFGLYGDPNVIAVTRIWGIFGGLPAARRIDQFDILFNVSYRWGDALVSGNAVMDLLNIATHEIGHGVGLGDLYNACTSETMYGYSNYGEIQKRDLNIGDVQGLQKLYGI